VTAARGRPGTAARPMHAFGQLAGSQDFRREAPARACAADRLETLCAANATGMCRQRRAWLRTDVPAFSRGDMPLPSCKRQHNRCRPCESRMCVLPPCTHARGMCCRTRACMHGPAGMGPTERLVAQARGHQVADEAPPRLIHRLLRPKWHRALCGSVCFEGDEFGHSGNPWAHVRGLIRRRCWPLLLRLRTTPAIVGYIALWHGAPPCCRSHGRPGHRRREHCAHKFSSAWPWRRIDYTTPAGLLREGTIFPAQAASPNVSALYIKLAERSGVCRHACCPLKCVTCT
jgi:hypothetical protein